jgi:hypothetical protein
MTRENVVCDTAEGWMDNPEPVSRATVRHWISQHDGPTFAEFIEDNGDQDEYDSNVVFEWLGY